MPRACTRCPRPRTMRSTSRCHLCPHRIRCSSRHCSHLLLRPVWRATSGHSLRLGGVPPNACFVGRGELSVPGASPSSLLLGRFGWACVRHHHHHTHSTTRSLFRVYIFASARHPTTVVLLVAPLLIEHVQPPSISPSVFYAAFFRPLVPVQSSAPPCMHLPISPSPHLPLRFHHSLFLTPSLHLRERILTIPSFPVSYILILFFISLPPATYYLPPYASFPPSMHSSLPTATALLAISSSSPSPWFTRLLARPQDLDLNPYHIRAGLS